MDHQLALLGHNNWQCNVCLYHWKGKPSSECPGLPFYETGKYPDTLIPQGLLFGRGLKLAEGQKPVAVHGKYLKYSDPLYALSECIPHGVNITFDEGKYKFAEETDQGFTIWRVNGLRLKIKMRDSWLFVGNMPLGLYEFKEGVAMAAGWFADQLLTHASDSERRDAVEFIGKALSRRFYLQWRRLIDLAKINAPELEALARLMWASRQGDAPILHLPALYADDALYIRTDLMKYHACRMYAATLTGVNEDLAKLAAWREQLTPTVPNKALNKTLDKMPIAISYSHITRLSTINLSAPVTNRLHLIFILCASDHHNWGLHEHLVIDATPEMIQQIGLIYGHVLKPMSRTRIIGGIARLILDFPQPYNGDLLGLAQRSREWHQNFDSADTELLPADTPLAVPTNIDLAALEEVGITLLRTAGDCYKEHDRMHHCVHTYASKAAHGLCYLFHVDLKVYDPPTQANVIFRATVEVAPDGRVVQAHGPSNVRNPACDYGVRQIQLAVKQPVLERG